MRLVLAILTLGFALVVKASAPAETIEDFIATEMPASGAPGLAYAVVKNGEVTATGEHGVIVNTGDAAVTANTAFIIGSVSKSFTALAVMQLVESDKIELDAPIGQYLDVLVDQPAGNITVRQLLSHTSGYDTYQGNLSQTDFSMRPDALERRVARIAELTPANAPGTQWNYSNANYQLLGRIIETVSGQDYPAYIQTNILTPAGMTNSFVHDAQVRSSMATGHTPWFGSKSALTENKTGLGSASQGGIVATAGDMGR